ncbi:GGDEF domain-containing protein [Williamsia sp. Leaf354]|uniref:GGDEF domain-containing protein n=1 Tax=Williamsia sp. Leaf354 TaxID=1736349 RepID=UPI000B19865D|nr:GGDEF domain-containing protein [Williamsia sp. Leaf354]
MHTDPETPSGPAASPDPLPPAATTRPPAGLPREPDRRADAAVDESRRRRMHSISELDTDPRTGVVVGRGRGSATARMMRRFDARSAAVLLSTSGSLPLPVLGFLQPAFIRDGGLPWLVTVWMFTLLVFSTTLVVGRLGDRLFAVFGFIGMVGIAVAAYVVTEPAASGVIITLLAAIPAIAAMSSSRRVVVSFSMFAVALAIGLAFIDVTSVVGVIVRCGAGVANVMVPVFIVAALRNSLEVTMERYAVLGDTDPLTGLLNRRGFLARSGDLLATVATAGDQIGFLLIDVDHFKAINDRLGHAVGDTVLVDTVAAITSAAPRSSLIGRFGGEEFVVLCGTTGQAALSATAERIREAVAAGSTVTVSIGAVAAPLSSTRSGRPNISHVIDHLTHLADRWVYVAKSAGRDRVVCLSSSPIHFVEGNAVGAVAPARRMA